jgi:RNA polymerase sigma-70 factor (ECF subfamily)
VFEYLYDNYSAALYGVITRIVREEPVAEEVMHDAFLRIWNKIGTYDPEKGRLFTWMLNLTRNLAIDKTRSKDGNRARKTSGLENLVDTQDDRGAYSPEDVIGLNEVLNKLPAEQKFIVEYLYLKGYSQSELAEEFNIPLGTVKTRTRLAMMALRTILKVK